MLWGQALATWESWGIRLMLAAAALGSVALLVSLASAYVFYRVAGAAQSELQAARQELSAQFEGQKLRSAGFEAEIRRLNAANHLLETRAQPRRLTGEESAKFSAALTNPPSVKLAVVSRLLDSEGKDFADDLAIAVNNSRWQASRFDTWVKPDRGVFIATVEGAVLLPEIKDTLESALDAAHVPHGIMTIRKTDLSTMSPPFQADVLYLLVGGKP